MKHATPGDVFRLAHTNPILHATLHAWQAGQFATWGDAMTAAAVALAESNARLLDLVSTEQLSRPVSPPDLASAAMPA